jgi:hypothetical protein
MTEMTRVSSLAAAASLAIAACRSAPPPPPPVAPAPVAAAPAAPASAPDGAPLDQDLPRLVARSLGMYQDIAKGFAASGEDCPAATAELHELAGRYRDVVVANAKVLHDGRATELRAALDPHDEEFDAAAAAVVQSPTMARCAPDPAFGKALDELLQPP